MLRFTESFEVVQTTTGKYAAGGFNVTPATGRASGNAGTVNGGSVFTKDLDAGMFTKFYGIALYIAGTPGADVGFFFVGENPTNAQGLSPYHVGLYVTPTMHLKVTRGSNVSTLGTGPTVLLLNTYYYIELKVKCHSTLGEIELRIDTQPELGAGSPGGALINQNTRNGGTGAISAFGYAWPAGVWQMDDFYCCDDQGTVNNTFRGPCLVQTRDAVPGNGGMVDWTTSAGADHGALVDEATVNGDTDYVSSNTPGHIDTFNMQDITYPGTSVAGVIVYNHARKTDVGLRTINGVCRIGGVNYVSPDPAQGLASAYNVHSSVFEVDPSTGSVWASAAAVNAAEFGPKLVA